jgi:hypothetical protein
MKKLLFLILFIVSLFGCSLIYYGQEDYTYSFNCPYIFDSVDEAFRFCQTKIGYVYDIDQYGYSDYWARPDQTIENRAGDCEDIAILFAYFAYSQFELESDLIISINGTHVHAYIEIDGKNYGDKIENGWSVYKRYTYHQAIWIAVNTHGLGVYGKNLE